MEQLIKIVERFIWSVPLIFILISTHIFFTFKLRFPQLRVFNAIKYIQKKDKRKNAINNSSFKTLMATLAGTLGVGNIIGVASAIISSGEGVVFWIFISGFFAIATKYAETYIVLKYRKKDKNGKYFGGAMYVLDEVLGKRKIAILFSIFVIISSFGIGSMIQSNSATTIISLNYNINTTTVSTIITLICGYVLIGNSKRIANISSIVVPIASSIYIIMCIIIILKYRTNLIPMLNNIYKSAFNFKSFFYGSSYVYILNMVSTGISKGIFSNEAGIGSSPMFDATTNCDNIHEQSLVSAFAVFFDTLVICILTAITILITFNYFYVQSPDQLINIVFSKIPYGNHFLVISLVIFAIATIPCWSFYGGTAINYIFKNKRFYNVIYKLIYIIVIYIGCNIKLSILWSVSSIANALMCIPNVYMLVKLNKEIIYKSSHKIFTKMK